MNQTLPMTVVESVLALLSLYTLYITVKRHKEKHTGEEILNSWIGIVVTIVILAITGWFAIGGWITHAISIVDK